MEKCISKKELGRLGEEIAARFLENHGVSIIKRNYFTKFGEIDLIGIQNRTIIFTEVKLRTSAWGGGLLESVDHRKIKHLTRAVSLFLQECHIQHDDFRFDVIAILYSRSTELSHIEWLKNAHFY